MENENIIIKASQTSHIGTRGQKKKLSRVWDRVHYCFFCPYSGSNISKHLRLHKDEPEVVDILNLELSSEEDKKGKVAARLEVLRNKGDNQHNVKVLESGKGDLVISRRNAQDLGKQPFDCQEYGPCPHCFRKGVKPSCTKWQMFRIEVYPHRTQEQVSGTSEKVQTGKGCTDDGVESSADGSLPINDTRC